MGSDANQEPDVAKATRIRRLTIARLVLLPTAFGMSVAAGITLIVAIAHAFAGKWSTLASVPTTVFLAALCVAAAYVAVPRLERRILELARRTPSQLACLPMLQLVNGLPLFSMRREAEAELTRQLADVDEEWWSANAKELREQVSALLEAAAHPSRIRPVDGPWVPALLTAIARCGQTDFIRRIESLLRRGGTKLPESIHTAGLEAIESLKRRQQRDREAATLLRPATAADSPLLRAVQSGALPDQNVLLRPECAPDSAEPATTEEMRPACEPNEQPQSVSLHTP